MPNGMAESYADKLETRLRQLTGFLRDHTDGSIKQRIERLFTWMNVDEGETPIVEAIHVLQLTCELIREMDALIDELEGKIR